MAKFSKTALIAAIRARKAQAEASAAERHNAEVRSYEAEFEGWRTRQLQQSLAQLASIKEQVKALDKLVAADVKSQPRPKSNAYTVSVSITRGKATFYPPVRYAGSGFDPEPFDKAIAELELMLGEEVTLPSSNKLLRLAL